MRFVNTLGVCACVSVCIVPLDSAQCGFTAQLDGPACVCLCLYLLRLAHGAGVGMLVGTCTMYTRSCKGENSQILHSCRADTAADTPPPTHRSTRVPAVLVCWFVPRCICVHASVCGHKNVYGMYARARAQLCAKVYAIYPQRQSVHNPGARVRSKYALIELHIHVRGGAAHSRTYYVQEIIRTRAYSACIAFRASYRLPFARLPVCPFSIGFAGRAGRARISAQRCREREMKQLARAGSRVSMPGSFTLGERYHTTHTYTTHVRRANARARVHTSHGELVTLNQVVVRVVRWRSRRVCDMHAEFMADDPTTTTTRRTPSPEPAAGVAGTKIDRPTRRWCERERERKGGEPGGRSDQ